MLGVYDVSCHKDMFVRQKHADVTPVGEHRSVKDLLSAMVLEFQDPNR